MGGKKETNNQDRKGQRSKPRQRNGKGREGENKNRMGEAGGGGGEEMLLIHDLNSYIERLRRCTNAKILKSHLVSKNENH